MRGGVLPAREITKSSSLSVATFSKTLDSPSTTGTGLLVVNAWLWLWLHRASEHLMKRPKADWVASLIAVTLLIFAAGAALDRSRLVRAASISSNLGRTTTATSLGTNLGRRHLELDVLVGVVTGTHGDGRRPQPGATPPTGTGAEVLV